MNIHVQGFHILIGSPQPGNLGGISLLGGAVNKQRVMKRIKGAEIQDAINIYPSRTAHVVISPSLVFSLTDTPT